MYEEAIGDDEASRTLDMSTRMAVRYVLETDTRGVRVGLHWIGMFGKTFFRVNGCYAGPYHIIHDSSVSARFASPSASPPFRLTFFGSCNDPMSPVHPWYIAPHIYRARSPQQYLYAVLCPVYIHTLGRHPASRGGSSGWKLPCWQLVCNSAAFLISGSYAI